MKIRDLEYFIELVKNKNFSVVADHFQLVSQQLRWQLTG